jgi:hypothetical protein
LPSGHPYEVPKKVPTHFSGCFAFKSLADYTSWNKETFFKKKEGKYLFEVETIKLKTL